MLKTLAMLLLASPAFAQAPQLPDAPGMVTTQATARDRVPNTVADVVFGIQTNGPTLAGVQADLAAASTQLGVYLKTSGVAEPRTQDVSVQPELEPKPSAGQPSRIIGYSGHLSVALQLDSTKLGDILGGALSHGANQIERTDLHPRVAEIDARHAALAAQATRTAMAEARAIAEAAGRRLGAVRSLVVQATGSIGARPMMVRAAALPSASMPIAVESGDSEIAATVSVTMSLIEP